MTTLSNHITSSLSAFRAEVIGRALTHAQTHIDRGMAREIEAPDAEKVETGFMTSLLDLGDATGAPEREAASIAAHDAFQAWKLVLERLSDGADDPHTHQCVEVDQGELLSLLRCVDSLDYLATDECRTKMTDSQIAIGLAAELFACPPAPEEY